MTADQDQPGEADPLLNPDGTRKKDLRYTEREQNNVRIERKMDGSGHLARGDKTHMSVLNFSARAQSRTERDPEFEFRPKPAPKPAAEAAPSAAAAAVPPAPAAAAPPPAADGAVRESGESPSLMKRVKRLFGF